MEFTSFAYTGFLAAFCFVYWLTLSKEIRKLQLLIASYLFYGWVNPVFCFLLLGSTLITYLCLWFFWLREPGKRFRWPLVVSIFCNIGVLVIFKYWGFFYENASAFSVFLGKEELSKDFINIALPLGLSFYSLQAVGLTVDAYKGDVSRQSLLDIAIFLAFFPKLISGPFEKASTFLKQLTEERQWDWTQMSNGIALLIFGFFKKLVIADNISPYVDRIFYSNPTSLIVLLTGSICFSIQILADFSGYTDLARGSAKLLGIDLMENFNFPYLAITPSDFWRRWHISLSKWFTTYVYIPLGGSRTDNKFKLFLTLLVTMGASGLWHGATVNFFIWGLFYGVLLFAYQSLGLDGHWIPQYKLTEWTARIIMMIWTIIGWTLFKAPSLGWIWASLRTTTFDREIAGMSLALVWLLFSALFVMLWAVPVLIDRYARSWWMRGGMYALMLAAIFILGQEAAGDFVYFQF